VFLNPLSKSFFVPFFNLDELVDESWVSGEWSQLLEVIKRSHPFVNATKTVTD